MFSISEYRLCLEGIVVNVSLEPSTQETHLLYFVWLSWILLPRERARDHLREGCHYWNDLSSRNASVNRCLDECRPILFVCQDEPKRAEMSMSVRQLSSMTNHRSTQIHLARFEFNQITGTTLRSGSTKQRHCWVMTTTTTKSLKNEKLINGQSIYSSTVNLWPDNLHRIGSKG